MVETLVEVMVLVLAGGAGGQDELGQEPVLVETLTLVTVWVDAVHLEVYGVGQFGDSLTVVVTVFPGPVETEMLVETLMLVTVSFLHVEE